MKPHISISDIHTILTALAASTIPGEEIETILQTLARYNDFTTLEIIQSYFGKLQAGEEAQP
jgi:hypothetical protein